MKSKSHETQLLKTVVHGREQKTTLQLNRVLFLRGGKRRLDVLTSFKMMKEDTKDKQLIEQS